MKSTLARARSSSVVPVDFRRPSQIGRDAVVALEGTHDAFVRRLSAAWSSGGYAPIELEHVATDQLTIDDFVQSLPHPTALATIRVGGLDAIAFLQVDLPFGLLYVERLLGGPGDPASAPVNRRPTDLEEALITHELFGPAVGAIDEALRELHAEPSVLLTFESAPQPLQLGSPDELLLVLTYHVEVRGDHLPSRGIVALAYPQAPLIGQLDRLVGGTTAASEEMLHEAEAAMTVALLGTSVDLRVRIGGGPIAASRVARLAVGDVLRLDHGVERPADLVCDGRHLGTAHLGTRGRRLAAQVVTPPAIATA